MEGTTWLPWKHDRFYQTLAAQIVVIHFRRVLGKAQVIIRFVNNYGVIILPLSIEKNDDIFEMLVLKFYGPKLDDYQVTQYGPIYELNCGNLDEIIGLCELVSLLPKSQVTASFGPSKAKIIKGEYERRCSNFF